MNARLAIQENERQARELLESAKLLSIRKEISIEEAIDCKVSAGVKYSTYKNQKVAWVIRGKEAKKLI